MGSIASLRGHAHKLMIDASEQQPLAEYQLRLGDNTLALNPLLGQRISLRFMGEIRCITCGRATRKSFSQGHCYRCFTTLARCDRCIMSPEHCHYYAGTCREPAWGERHCFKPHIVYLAASANLKVGITKPSQMPVRWLDQGASRALPIFDVQSRQQSGLVEDVLRQQVSDRTPWQRMLKGEQSSADLVASREALMQQFAPQLAALRQRFGEAAIKPRFDDVRHFDYPVLQSPTSIKSVDLEKTPVLEGTLLGLKGQYLLLDSGVINLRRFQGYLLEFEAA